MCFVMMIVLIVCAFSDVLIQSGEIYGEYTEKTGTVTASSLNVRSGPGTTHSILGTVHSGEVVRIVGEANASDGKIWYQINFKDGKGYVSSSYISNIKDIIDYTPDADFEAYLNEQGFPESYKPGLRELHAKYPKWIFVADHLSYDWNTAWTNQSKVGRSLISKNAISSHKSLATGSYNWDTGVWTTFDGGAWCAASEELVAYYMDPRNFFNENYIWMFEQMSFESEFQTIDKLELILAGTFMDNEANYVVNDTTGDKSTYSEILMIAARESKVSPFALAASILVEMGNQGTSNSISGTLSGYEGYYNYYNWGAYAHSGRTPIVNGLIYASKTDASTMRPWDTRYKAIIGGAIKFGVSYINIGQDTLYYKKFDYVGAPYTHQYMTHIKAHATEAKKTSQAYNAELKENTSIIFKIPVFKNMPEKACPYPTGDGSPNNTLSTLVIAGQSLTPTFNKFTTEYSLVVENEVSSIEVNATASVSSATVKGTGAYNLEVGSNKVTLNVTAQNGAVRTYTVEIVRLPSEEDDENSSTGGSSGENSSGESSSGGESGENSSESGTQKPTEPPLTVDTTLNKNDETSVLSAVKLGTTVSGLLNTFTISGGTISVVDKNGVAKTEGNIGTGDKVVISNTSKTEQYTYTVIIYGDVNGDGSANIKDLLIMKKHLLGATTLSDIYLKAGDANRDSASINIKDLLVVQKHILGASTIKQD